MLQKPEDMSKLQCFDYEFSS